MSQFNANPGKGVPNIGTGKGDPSFSRGDDSSPIIINPSTSVLPGGILTTFQLGVKESLSPIITLGDSPDRGTLKPDIINATDTTPLLRDGGKDPNNPGSGGDNFEQNTGGPPRDVVFVRPGGGVIDNDTPIITTPPPPDPTVIINDDFGDGSPPPPPPPDNPPPEPPPPPPEPPPPPPEPPPPPPEPPPPPPPEPPPPPPPEPPPPPPVIAVPIAANSVTASNDDPFFTANRSVSQYGIDFGLQSRTITSTGNPQFGSPLRRNLDTPLTAGLRDNERLASVLGSLNVDDFSSDNIVPSDHGPTLPAQSTDGHVLPGITSGAELASPNTLARDQPLDVNYLYQTFFRLNIPMFPQLNYFCQRVTLPGFGAASAIERPTRFSNIKMPENKVTFDNLEVTFLVDKNLNNWREIQEWMKRIYLIKDHTQILPNAKDHVSTANLFFLNSAMNANLQVMFKDIFPVSLSGLDFDSSVTDLTPFTATATFAYTTYEFVDPETGSSM